MLTSFKIQNFRTFRDLQIERLGHVNLVVGKNNVGKSSLLEALRFYAHQGAPALIWEILTARDEINRTSTSNSGLVREERTTLAFEHLFYGRKRIETKSEPIQIGPINSLEDTLFVALEWHLERRDEEGKRHFEPVQPAGPKDLRLALTIRMGSRPQKYCHSKTLFVFDPAFGHHQNI